MSESNLSVLRYRAEATFGTTPASPAFKELLNRSSSLKYEPQTVTDDQLSGDRSIRDANLVGYDVNGDIQARLTYGALDDIFESLMYSTWNLRPSQVASAVTVSAYTVAANGTAFVAGMLVFAKGFATANNNGLKLVGSGSTATSVSVTGLTAEATAPAGASITVVGFQGVSGGVAMTASPNVATLTTLNPISMGIVVGMWVKMGGTATVNQFATPANNGWYRVSAVTATTITFDVVPTGYAADVGTAKLISIFMPDYMRDGTTRRSFTFERQYSNTAGTVYYEYFRGCVIGQGRLQLQSRQNIEANFDVLGLTASDVGTVRLASSTTVAPEASKIMNTSSNIAQIRAANAPLTGAAATISANIMMNNNLRTREGVGSSAVIDVRAGRFDAQVEMTSFFEDTTLINRLRLDQETSFDFIMRTPDTTQAYLVDFPRGKYTAGEIQTGRIDTDITTPLTMQALRHAALGYTMQLARFNYVE